MYQPGETLARRTRRLLAELGHQPRKSRGQSFLVDPTVAARIAQLVCGDDRPPVLEIGVGLGALTERLAECASQVVGVEIEGAFAAAARLLLAERPAVRIVAADALALDFAELCGGTCRGWRVAGNLPYSVGTAILLRLFKVQPPPERVVVTVQREVGERLAARPGDRQYGSLSVLAAYRLVRAEAALRVPRGAFYPQPKVDSTVLVLEPRQAPLSEVGNEALLLAVVRASFGHRRKKLANSLVNSRELDGLARATAEELLGQAGVAPGVRAEEVGLEGFVRLANVMEASGVRLRGRD